MQRKLLAEFFGTFWLVFGGCGSAVLAAAFPPVGIGLLGVAFAFGLTVLTMVYAVGQSPAGTSIRRCRSGSRSLAASPWSDLVPYWIAQVVGGLVAAFVLYIDRLGQGGLRRRRRLRLERLRDLSPGGYGLLACLVIEVVLTAGFLIIILGPPRRRARLGFAPIAIGLALTLIHLISIPVTNTSVNPARSTGPACSSADRRWRSSGCSGWPR